MAATARTEERVISRALVSANQGRSRIERLELANGFCFSTLSEKNKFWGPPENVLFSILIFENVKNQLLCFFKTKGGKGEGDRHRAAVWRTEFPIGFLRLCEAYQKQLRVHDLHRNSRGPLFFESSFVSHSMQRGPFFWKA